MTIPTRVATTANWTSTGSTSGSTPITVTKQSNVALGDLMVIVIADNSVFLPLLFEVDDLTDFDPKITPPSGWEFRGVSYSLIDYTGSSNDSYGVRKYSMLALYTKRAGADDLAATSYEFTRPPKADSSARSTSSWVTMLVYRNASFTSISKDSIGYGYLPGTLTVDRTTRGGWQSGDPAKTFTHTFPGIPTDAATDEALGVGIAWTPVTADVHTTNGTMVFNTGGRPHMAELGNLEGPTASPPTLSRTKSGSYSAAALGFILNPVGALPIFQIPAPTVSFTSVSPSVLHARAEIPLPSASITASVADPIPVADIDTYVLDWDPTYYWKFDEAAPLSGSGTLAVADYGSASSPYNLSYNSGTNIITTGPAITTTKGTSLSLERTSFSSGGWKDTVSRPEINLAEVTLLGRFLPLTNGVLIEHSWSNIERMFVLEIVGGYLKVSVELGRGGNPPVNLTATDTSPLDFGSSYTLGFRWDGLVLSLIRDGSVVATATSPVAERTHLLTSSFGELSIGGSYFETNKVWKGAINRLALFRYKLPDSVIQNYHRLASSSSPLATDPPKWGEGQPPAAAVSDTYGLAVLADSPSFYYRLDEEDGAAWLRDSSSNGRDAILNGIVPWSPFTQDVRGANFIMEQAGLLPSYPAGDAGKVPSGSVSSIVLDTSSVVTGTSWTLEFITTRTITDPTSIFMDWGTSGSTAGIDLAQGNLRAYIYDTSSWSMLRSDPVPRTNYPDNLENPSDEIRYHYVLVCDSSSVRVYEAGVLVTTLDTSSITGSGTYYDGGIRVVRFFPGLVVDEISIYNTALSPTRIAAHWSATGLTAPPDSPTPPPPPAPIPEGQLVMEPFEGGAIDDLVAPSNSEFSLVIPGMEDYAKFVSGGFTGQGASPLGTDTYGVNLAWAQSPVRGLYKLYARSWVRINGSTGSGYGAGADVTIGTWILEDYAAWYPTGWTVGGVRLQGLQPYVLGGTGYSPEPTAFGSPVSPNTWYIIEAMADWSTMTITARIYDSSGVLISESSPVPYIDIETLSISPDANTNKPMAATLTLKNSSDSTVVVDNFGVNDFDWQADGEPVPSILGFARWFDGTDEQGIPETSWWDGTTEQPVELLGWWNGTGFGPLSSS